MKLTELIKQLQDNIFEGNDPEVFVESKGQLFSIPFVGDYEDKIVIYTNGKPV